MTLCTSRSAVIALIFCTAVVQPVWGQQYLLYAPQTAPAGQKTSPQEGVLVKEIEIQKGDTLYGLSRKYSGRGMYYPQILLFNSIKNPNLIYPGATLKVPLSHDEVSDNGAEPKPLGASHKPAAPVGKKAPLKTEEAAAARQPKTAPPTPALSTELSLSDLKTVGTQKSSKATHKKKTGTLARKKQPHESPAPSPLSAALPASHTSTTVSTGSAGASDSGQKIFEAAVKAYRIDDCRTALELLDRYLSDYSGSPLAADANLYKAECYLKLSVQ